jgi:predicted RNA-binding protein with PUA-like domain
MSSWIVKSEPGTYSFDQFRKEKTTAWTGIRNFQARNFLRDMAKGDEVFFYHSGDGKEVVGTGTVIKAAYPDPTVEPGEKSEWLCVDLKAGVALPKPVTLATLKTHAKLKGILLVRHSRISVSPIDAAEAAELRKLGGL